MDLIDASVTGQPKKGRADYSSQALGNLDILNLLTYDTPGILQELLTSRSDDFKSKRQIITNIMQFGESDLPEETGGARTARLRKTILTSMGLLVTD